MYTTVIKNQEISPGIVELILELVLEDAVGTDCEASFTPLPGQFLMLYTDRKGDTLPCPISICDVKHLIPSVIRKDASKEPGKASTAIRLLIQKVGSKTNYFSMLQLGEQLRISKPLGKGFYFGPDASIHKNTSLDSDTSLSLQPNKGIALIGGGIGVPPLYSLAKAVREKEPQQKIFAFLGFRSKSILTEDFKALGVEVYVASDDGSEGFKGNVMELIQERYGQETKADALPFSALYGCGPKPLLRALCTYAEDKDIFCQVSMEERMACGFGACVGCAIKVKSSDSDWVYKKVCKDGPVFDGRELIWE